MVFSDKQKPPSQKYTYHCLNTKQIIKYVLNITILYQLVALTNIWIQCVIVYLFQNFIFYLIFNIKFLVMEKKSSTELLNIDSHYMKNASSDSLASDSKSSSLNSKLGQDSVSSQYLVMSISNS